MPAREPDKSAEPTTSTSATDASTTEGAKTAGANQPQRVVVEQAPAEPAVYYGEGGIVPGSGAATDPNKPHVKADYQPFKW